MRKNANRKKKDILLYRMSCLYAVVICVFLAVIVSGYGFSSNSAGRKKAAQKNQNQKQQTNKSYFGLPETYPVSDARYLTEDMILRRARDILAYAKKHKYLYGDSKTTPPCTDGLISCDRLIASVLWSYGFTDQAKGGIVVKDEGNERHDMSTYLKRHGFTESIGMDDVKRGSILIVTDMRGNWKGHAFILAEMEGDTVELPDGENVKRFDAGDVWAAASQTGEYPDEPVRGFQYPKDDTVFVYNLPEITEEMLEGIYDYNYYISYHPEVVKITGGDRDKTLRFFFNYGIDQGHQGCAAFNVFDYMDAHPELTVKYGKDLRSYYYQYMNI